MDRLLHAAKQADGLHVLAWAGEEAAVLRAQLCGPGERLGLIPVPLSPSRLAARGFNQSLEWAKVWVGCWGEDEVLTDAIIRIRETAVQQSLSWVERRRNVRGAFSATGPLQGRRVVLLDDVVTTGSTLAEVARVALRAGAASVDAVVLARVDPPALQRRMTRFGALPR